MDTVQPLPTGVRKLPGERPTAAIASAAAAVPLEYPRTSYSPTPLDGVSELDYSPTHLDYSPTPFDGGSELYYSPTPLEGGSEPMADQDPGPNQSVAEPMVAAKELDDDCQIVYIDPMGTADDEEEDEVLD